MKKLGVLFALITISVFLLSSQSIAQHRMKWSGSGGWGPDGRYARMYNTATVEDLAGEVTSIEKIIPRKGMSHGIHLTLKTDKETISIHLGPSWYIDNQDIKIEAGDSIEVKGSRITYAEKPAIIASEIKKGDAILTLRDENGFPAWAGWRRR
ncbi:MAG: DNA-binding protein [delta proteobacterium ML8_D]|jgi:hypothetical protein|nr:MAG: DNA-binding protein [delta proteobacterium ML8_D]